MTRGPIDRITIEPGSEDDKTLELYEEMSGDGGARLELREKSMNPNKKRLFDAAISETLKPIYRASVNMMESHQGRDDDAESVVA